MWWFFFAFAGPDAPRQARKLEPVSDLWQPGWTAGVRLGMIAGLCMGMDSSLLAQITQDAYVTNLVSGTVSVIDTSTQTVVSTINIGSYPEGVAVTPDGRHAYVGNVGFEDMPSMVSVIDTATHTVVKAINTGPSFGVAVAPDSLTAYVTNYPNTVLVIDTAAQAVVKAHQHRLFFFRGGGYPRRPARVRDEPLQHGVGDRYRYAGRGQHYHRGKLS